MPNLTASRYTLSLIPFHGRDKSLENFFKFIALYIYLHSDKIFIILTQILIQLTILILFFRRILSNQQRIISLLYTFSFLLFLFYYYFFFYYKNAQLHWVSYIIARLIAYNLNKKIFHLLR